MKEKDMYCIIIPENVLYRKKLCANAKLLYGEILNLCNDKGYCWAGNNYFAKLFQVSTTSISLWITLLRKNGFIKCKIKENRRKIFLKAKLSILKATFEKEALRKVKHIYKEQEQLSSAALADTDNFNIETKEWKDKKGQIHGRDSIDYGETDE